MAKLKAHLEDIENYPRRYTDITEHQNKKGDKAKEEAE